MQYDESCINDSYLLHEMIVNVYWDRSRFSRQFCRLNHYFDAVYQYRLLSFSFKIAFHWLKCKGCIPWKMLDFNFLEPKLNHVVKVVIAVKVVCFLIISGVESGYDIYESIKFDKCVEEVASEMKAKNLRSPDAKAIHYCEGGDLVSLDD